jgi:hypothetical protein
MATAMTSIASSSVISEAKRAARSAWMTSLIRRAPRNDLRSNASSDQAKPIAILGDDIDQNVRVEFVTSWHPQTDRHAGPA